MSSGRGSRGRSLFELSVDDGVVMWRDVAVVLGVTIDDDAVEKIPARLLPEDMRDSDGEDSISR